MTISMGINVLIVGDGYAPGVYGITFSPRQDPSDCNFSISELLYLLQNSAALARITVETASRNNDPNATYGNFVFTDASLLKYEVLWLAAYEGLDDGKYPQISAPALAEAERLAIWNFMQRGGGVFAAGDHSGLGSIMCGNLPRIRTMRKWYSQPSDLPPDVQSGIDCNGEIVPMSNWGGGLESSNSGFPRLDTLQRNPSDTGSVFDFDNQSDDEPQVLTLLVEHPILQATTGPINRFPDHMHEGEVVTPANPSGGMTIAGQGFDEFPYNYVGLRPLPQIIAVSTPQADHSVVVSSGTGTSLMGTSCPPFFGDSAPSQAGTHGAICVYDGWLAGAGRIITQSTFHHFLDLNLVGNPRALTTDRQHGLGPAYMPPAAGSTLDLLREYYVNVVQWLSRPRRGIAATPRVGVADRTDVFAIDDAGNIVISSVILSGTWTGPIADFSPYHLFPPYAGIATAPRFATYGQNDVYAVSNAGTIQVFSATAGGLWSNTGSIGAAGRFPPGAYVAASNQFGVGGQNDVFAIDTNGGICVAWTGASNDWNGPVGIGVINAPPGCALAVSQRFGVPPRTDIYVVSTEGIVTVTSAVGAGNWTVAPPASSQQGQFPAGAPLAAGNQIGIATQTDIFVVDNNGTMNVLWATGNNAWSGAPLGQAGIFPPGAHVATSQRFGIADQTDVYAVDLTGTLRCASLVQGGPWSYFQPVSAAGLFQPGAAVAVQNQVGLPTQTDVFARTKSGWLAVFWVVANGNWNGPAAI